MKKTSSLVALFATLAIGVHAQPALMNYQGRLLDAAGQPLTNGSYRLEFNIYDSANAGAKVWGPFLYDDGSGNGHGAKAVVANGRFNVILATNDTTGRPLTNAFTAPNRFVEIKVEGGSPILPRQQFLSAPYALQSQDAQVAQLAQMAVQASNLVQQAADALCPPGTIVAFGGANVPSGWLLCDGSALASTNRGRLFAAISRAWGDGSFHQGIVEAPANPGTDFNVPDLRGMFLRGVDGTAGKDPDSTSRSTSATGGNIGNAVGSAQTDVFESHIHQIKRDASGGYNGNLVEGDSDRIHPGVYSETDPKGGNETRPKNVYVNYIIKY